MATEILMPALSPTMEEGTLAKWLVKEGDPVKSGDILAEIETDKATMEFEAVDEGVIGALLVAEGTSGVKVNAPIATLLEDGEEAGAAPAPKAEADAGPATAGKPAPDATAGADAAAQADTKPAKAQAEGAQDQLDDKAAKAGEAPAAKPSAPAPQAPGTRVFASPLARRLAADKGVALAAINGTGPNGRIVKADVEGAQPGKAAPSQTAPQAAPSQATPQAGTAQPAPAAAGPVGAMPQGMSADTVKKMFADRQTEEVLLDGMRKTIAQRLTEAKQTIPHFYLRRSARIDALLAFRAQLNAALEGRGTKLSVNDFIIKACALALQEVPDANAVWAGDRILKVKPSDVGVAVAVEGGLFVPVIRDADSKTLSALSHEMRELGAKAKRKKLAPAEYQGGSFAISNLGMFGIENFDAVINPPHGSILAVGAGLKQPVVEGDEIKIATVMSMTLSVDHRVIDGALGARLLERIVTHLENPMAMLA